MAEVDPHGHRSRPAALFRVHLYQLLRALQLLRNRARIRVRRNSVLRSVVLGHGDRDQRSEMGDSQATNRGVRQVCGFTCSAARREYLYRDLPRVMAGLTPVACILWQAIDHKRINGAPGEIARGRKPARPFGTASAKARRRLARRARPRRTIELSGFIVGSSNLEPPPHSSRSSDRIERRENMARPERFELPTFWFVGITQNPPESQKGRATIKFNDLPASISPIAA